MELLLNVLMFSSLAHAGTPWDWSQSVKYQENHDPSVIWLTDGRKLKVSYAAISWKTVDSWSKDRPLLLAYQPESGVVLVDPESGKAIPALRGMGEHPIELLTEKCVQENSTTTGMVGCYGEGRKRWEQEMNRAHKALLGTLNEVQKKAVTESQQQWLKFQDSQSAAISALNNKDGTVWNIVAAKQAMQLVREQAERLNSQLDPL